MFQSCYNTFQIMSSSLNHQALIDGASDILVIKNLTGQFFCTGFFICFGPYAVTNLEQSVYITVNKKAIYDVTFKIDRHGYVHPYYPTNLQLKSMDLQWGCNEICFTLAQRTIKAQLYLLTDFDKIVICDLDGTATKSNVKGLLYNIFDIDYFHDDYVSLMQRIVQNGYHIVWVTMRALPLYQMTKGYLRKYVGIQGALITQPQQLLSATKKQLLKQSANIKINIMCNIRNVFSKNVQPIVAGLGNTTNDSIAYLHAKVPLQKIYQIDHKSKIQRLDDATKSITYKEILQNLNEYFPPITIPYYMFCCSEKFRS